MTADRSPYAATADVASLFRATAATSRSAFATIHCSVKGNSISNILTVPSHTFKIYERDKHEGFSILSKGSCISHRIILANSKYFVNNKVANSKDKCQ